MTNTLLSYNLLDISYDGLYPLVSTYGGGGSTIELPTGSSWRPIIMMY